MKIKGIIGEYFIAGKPWRDRLGIFLNRYQRGNELINLGKDGFLILGLGSLLIGVTLNIPQWWLPIIVACWLVGCYTMGYLDERFGFWKNQQQHLAGTINPVTMKLIKIEKDIVEIKKWLKKGK